MAAHKTSAVADEPIDVLFALHPKFDFLDFAGPLEVFTSAQHDPKDECEWFPHIATVNIQGNRC
jgi:transcriptional regulator GlxA family with amidase domain